MSKIAEQKALEAFPMDEYEFDKAKKSNIERQRFAYIQGYDKAIQDFLEKACEWLEMKIICYSKQEYEELIDNFKNYMQDESKN